MSAPDDVPKDQVAPEETDASADRDLSAPDSRHGTRSGATPADPPVHEEAYEFLIRALAYTQLSLRCQGHVSGSELLGGFRDLAIHDFGPLARVVLDHWGVRSTEDVGGMVRHLVDCGQWSRRREDHWDEFSGGYDFRRAFDEEYPWNVRKALGLVADTTEE